MATRRRSGLHFLFLVLLSVVQATSTLEDKVKFVFREVLIHIKLATVLQTIDRYVQTWL